MLWPSRSGNLMVKSRIMSPLLSGHLDSGRPSPTMRFFIPGLTMSLEVTVMVRPSSVGALTVQPHKACGREGAQGCRINTSGRICSWTHMQHFEVLYCLRSRLHCQPKSHFQLLQIETESLCLSSERSLSQEICFVQN